MDHFPLSKSGFSTIEMCPWAAYAWRHLGYKKLSSPAAELGKKVHDIWGKIISGQMTLDEGCALFKGEEHIDLLIKAVGNYPIAWGEGHVLELYLEADAETVWNKRTRKGLVCGYLDHTGIDFQAEMPFVTDLKTGRWVSDDVFERHLYAWLAAKYYGPKRGIKFYRFYCYSNTIQEFIYTPEQLDGEVNEAVMAAVEKVRATEPLPSPGDHCENWYGQPCQFLGRECPLSQDLPQVIESHIPTMQPQGRAFLEVLRGSIETKDQASAAFEAVQQLEGAVKAVKEKIQTYCVDAGPIRVGDQFYGWKPSFQHVVNKQFVIQTAIESGLSLDDMAKIFNISKESISHLSGKENRDIRDYMLDMGVTSVESNQRFGRIKA